MATPIKHRGKWRIRWIDAEGARRSEVFEDFNDAKRALRARQVEADEIRAGTRAKRPDDHTFGELCEHWLATRGAAKRSASDDKSICKRLREFLGGDAAFYTRVAILLDVPRASSPSRRSRKS